MGYLSPRKTSVLKGKSRKDCKNTVGKSQINIRSKTGSKTGSDQ